MIQLYVRLHGILRDRLPPERRGRVTMTLPQKTTIAAVLEELALHRHIQVAVNDKIEENLSRQLRDGDHLDIFRPSAGGGQNE
jgi:sulfur carrier protein ThiS